MLRERLDVLGSRELVVVGRADVDQGADGLVRRGGRVKGRVVDGVTVDLADVEIFFDFGDVSGFDAVGNTPDFRVRRGRVWVG